MKAEETMRALVICLVVWIGCASVPRVEMPEILPQLIEQDPLPPPTSLMRDSELKLELSMLITEEGSVARVNLLTPTGDEAWNEEAQKRIKRWRFSPAQMKGKPVSIWIRQSVRVRSQAPLVMRLTQIVCSNRSLADSLYALMHAGAGIETIAFRSEKEGSVQTGMVDVRRYPWEVQAKLEQLKVNKFSSPVRLGERYIIFKRLENGASIPPGKVLNQ